MSRSPSQIARRQGSKGFCCDHGAGHIRRACAGCWTRETLYCALHVRAHRRLGPRCIAEQYRKCEENFRSRHVKASAAPTVDLQSLADLAEAPHGICFDRRSVHKPVHCLSKTTVQVSRLPLESVPDQVLVRVLPSAETTLRIMVITCPSFFLVLSIVFSSIRLMFTVSASAAPLSG